MTSTNKWFEGFLLEHNEVNGSGVVHVDRKLFVTVAFCDTVALARRSTPVNLELSRLFVSSSSR